jgi:hypothetical protein
LTPSDEIVRVVGSDDKRVALEELDYHGHVLRSHWSGFEESIIQVD